MNVKSVETKEELELEPVEKKAKLELELVESKEDDRYDRVF